MRDGWSAPVFGMKVPSLKITNVWIVWVVFKSTKWLTLQKHILIYPPDLTVHVWCTVLCFVFMACIRRRFVEIIYRATESAWQSIPSLDAASKDHMAAVTKAMVRSKSKDIKRRDAHVRNLSILGSKQYRNAIPRRCRGTILSCSSMLHNYAFSLTRVIWYYEARHVWKQNCSAMNFKLTAPWTSN